MTNSRLYYYISFKNYNIISFERKSCKYYDRITILMKCHLFLFSNIDARHLRLKRYMYSNSIPNP
jgi:hypothetical protein